MGNARIAKNLGRMEEELEKFEIQEALNMVENRHSFHLGLVLGLVFAVAAGFFAIIFHEIFILEMTFRAKAVITAVSALIMLLCLYWGLTEDRRNKELRMKIWAHIKSKGARRTHTAEGES